MVVKLWYVWSGAKGHFVRSKRPPRDAHLAAALQRLKIRLASTQDRRELFEFQRAAYETEPEIWLPGEANLDKVREGLNKWNPAEYPNTFVIVAELNGKIIGLLLLGVSYRFDNACPSAWIENLFVLKSFRGYGVATRLVKFAKELAQQRGCKGLSLIVGLRNLAGVRFYRRCGFQINKEVGLASYVLKPVQKRKAHGRSRG